MMNRGRRFFPDRKDYEAFVGILKDTSEMWHVRIAALYRRPADDLRSMNTVPSAALSNE
jgi:hypothetical protein